MRLFWIVLAGLLLYTGVQLHLLLPVAPTFLVGSATILLFVLMLGWQFLYRSHAVAIEAVWFFVLAWCGAILFGIWSTYVLLSLPVSVVALAAAGATGATPDWLHAALLVALALAIGTAFVGFVQALRGPVLRRVDVPVRGLHPDLAGLTMAQISDLHVGPTIRRAYVAHVVRRTLELKPDVIALTGDLADGHPERLAEAVSPLRQLAAPLGVYCITGNHEYYWGAQRWLDKLTELGAVALIDRHVIVRRGAARLLIGGVADTSGAHFIAAHRGDPALAAADSGAADFRLLLAHRPGVCERAAAAGFDLQLSGHTHGGQFVPFNLVVRLAHRYHRGLIRHGRMWLYVSAGTGYWGPPHRFWIPAEITLLRLVAAERGE